MVLFCSPEVDNPSDLVAVVDSDGEIVDVVEKPSNDIGNLAIGGIYIFDETFWSRLDLVQNKDNFSISDVTKQYLSERNVKIISVGENTWIDCGTPSSLSRAAKMVELGMFRIRE